MPGVSASTDTARLSPSARSIANQRSTPRLGSRIERIVAPPATSVAVSGVRPTFGTSCVPVTRRRVGSRRQRSHPEGCDRSGGCHERERERADPSHHRATIRHDPLSSLRRPGTPRAHPGRRAPRTPGASEGNGRTDGSGEPHATGAADASGSTDGSGTSHGSGDADATGVTEATGAGEATAGWDASGPTGAAEGWTGAADGLDRGRGRLGGGARRRHGSRRGLGRCGRRLGGRARGLRGGGRRLGRGRRWRAAARYPARTGARPGSCPEARSRRPSRPGCRPWPTRTPDARGVRPHQLGVVAALAGAGVGVPGVVGLLGGPAGDRALGAGRRARCRSPSRCSRRRPRGRRCARTRRSASRLSAQACATAAASGFQVRSGMVTAWPRRAVSAAATVWRSVLWAARTPVGCGSSRGGPRATGAAPGRRGPVDGRGGDRRGATGGGWTGAVEAGGRRVPRTRAGGDRRGRRRGARRRRRARTGARRSSSLAARSRRPSRSACRRWPCRSRRRSCRPTPSGCSGRRRRRSCSCPRCSSPARAAQLPTARSALVAGSKPRLPVDVLAERAAVGVVLEGVRGQQVVRPRLRDGGRLGAPGQRRGSSTCLPRRAVSAAATVWRTWLCAAITTPARQAAPPRP